MLTTCAFIFLSLFSLALGKVDFVAKHCDNVADAKNAFELLNVDLKTYPIKVPGIVEAGIKFKVKNPPLQGRKYDVEFDMTRSTFFLDFQVPCINGFGSCKFDFCEYLTNKSKELAVGGKCKDLPCSCEELKAQTYDVPSFKVNFEKDDLPFPAKSLIYGDYKIDIKLYRHDTREMMGCVHVEFTLAEPECTGLFCDRR